jgi:TatD DNase family protein
MQYIDTHAHLNDEQFNQDVGEVIARAAEKSVERIIVCGYDIHSSRRAVQLARQYDGIFATVGIHPHDAATVDESSLSLLTELAKQPKVLAIGEIGMDYHYTFCPRHIQAEAFEAQVNLAAQLNLPIVIHSRDSIADSIHLLSSKAKKIVGGVFHCYGGDEEILQKVLALGMYIGIDGPITFKDPGKLVMALRCCPLDRILIETDCPYLAPEPLRGKRNEPAYLPYVAEKVAQILGVSTQYVATLTSRNARTLFGKGL